MDDQELIEAVAVEVMGWFLDNEFRLLEPETTTALTRMPSTSPFVDKIRLTGFCLPGANPFYEGTFFNPLADANNWMMVIERIMELGGARFNLLIDFREKNHTIIALWDHDLSDEWEEFEEMQIGKAVCLAALEAVRSLKASQEIN